jgi:hypothetical protein
MSFAKQPRATCRTTMRVLGSLCRPALRQGVRESQADHYVKRYDSVGFALAWIGYFFLQLSSVRELRVRLSLDRALKNMVGWGDISDAQLNRLHHVRPAQLWEPLVAQLIARVQGTRMPSHIRLFDTSFFTMSTKLLKRRYPRKLMGPGTAGMKLGAVLDPDSCLPLRVCSRVGQDADTGWLDDLVPPGELIAGLFFIFDRGFRKYAFFERLINEGADFLTRATEQIRYEVKRQLALDPRHPLVSSDEIVVLGSHNGHNLMQHPVRRIGMNKQVRKNRKSAPQQLVFLTSDMDTPAWELYELYRRRWEIETFFRWFKRTIGCVRPLGHSDQAAAHSFYAALVAYLIVLIVHQPTMAKEGRTTAPRLARTFYRIRAVLYQRPPGYIEKALQFL